MLWQSSVQAGFHACPQITQHRNGKRADAAACPYEWLVSFRESKSQNPRFQQLWGSSPRRHEQIMKDVLNGQAFIPPHRSLSTVTQKGQAQRPAPTNGWFRSESQIRKTPSSHNHGCPVNDHGNRLRRKFCRGRLPRLPASTVSADVDC